MRRGAVDLIVGLDAFISVLVLDAVVVAELLQLAGAGAHAGQALALMVGKDELEGGFSGFHDAGRVREDFHAFVHGEHAGGDEASRALDLHHADAAGADLVDVLEEAERRDLDPGLAAGSQNGAARFDGIISAVDFDIDFSHLTVLLISWKSRRTCTSPCKRRT